MSRSAARYDRVGEEVLNNQGCLMKIVEYNNSSDITVEFQDEYKTRIKTNYGNFTKGKIRNPYAKIMYGVGIVGLKYKTQNGTKEIKEYQTWHDMLYRVYGCNRSDSTSKRYRLCSVCDEWLLFENFCEWVRSQENYDKWLNGKHWCIDKDIIIKGNKIYCPETCCLVPNNVNTLFVKRDAVRGDMPVGVHKNHNRFCALCSNSITGKNEYFGTYDTQEEAFVAYKNGKEHIVKLVAQIEFDKRNITEKCYNAMMNYEVEITD